MTQVYGNLVDDQTRCVHYHSKLDIVAIKFYCCRKFYSCYYCHQRENHPVKRWPAEKFGEQAIICGNCKSLISIRYYLSHKSCPDCRALFNPGCSGHFHLYFQM